MDFFQLRTFYHVVKHMNFTHAAEELSISQPAVSRQIDTLEETIGMKLFHRAHRKVVLTEAGETLYRRSEKILGMVEQTQAIMEGMKNLETGLIKVGASTTMGNYFLAPLVMKFMKHYPGIQIQMTIQSTESVIERLEQKQLDMAVCAGPIHDSAFFTEPLVIDEIVLLSTPNHPLQQRKNLRLQDILDDRLILRSKGSNTRLTIEKHFQEYQVEMPKIIEFESTEAIKQAVMLGEGVTFLSKRTVDLELKANALKIIEGKQLKTMRQFYIVLTKEDYPTPASLALKAYMKKNTNTIH